MVLLLRQTEIIEHAAYSIEKGRLRALTEQVPSAAMLDELQTPNRVVANLVTPAVVYIETTRTVRLGDLALMTERLKLPEFSDAHPWLRGDANDQDSDEERELVESSLGSGFVVDAENGYIVTNHHVTEGADSIEVVFHDGRRYDAEVVGVDPETDLAVLSVAAGRLFEVTFGDSGKLSVGDDVFALGSPFGLDGTFSRGIVSGLGRSNVAINNMVYQDFIQTDAVINPGNSGGPLVNLRGEVIGVNTAIATNTGNFNGVGFAIPSLRVQRLLPQLLAGGKIVRGFLGVGYRDVHDQRRRAEEELGWSEATGVIVASVQSNSPAEEAGLRDDDIIVEISGKPVNSSIDLKDVIAEIPPGRRVTIRFWRDGAFESVDATLVARRKAPS